MKLQQMSDVSQAVAAIAAVLSLIALIVQMRQSTKAQPDRAMHHQAQALQALRHPL